MAIDIRLVFNAANRQEADLKLKATVAKYQLLAPKLAVRLKENLPEGLTVLDFPEGRHKVLRPLMAWKG